MNQVFAIIGGMMGVVAIDRHAWPLLSVVAYCFVAAICLTIEKSKETNHANRN